MAVLTGSIPVPWSPYPWPDQLADALYAAINEAKVLALLIRRGDLGRRLQLEAAERRVRVLSGQLGEVRS